MPRREDRELLHQDRSQGRRRWKIAVAPAYLLFLAWWVAGGYFTEVGLALVSLACHEIAHLFVLAGYDVPVEALELHPFGAAIRYQAPSAGMGQVDAVVAAAGPLQSFLLATLAIYLEPIALFDPTKLRMFIHINLLLACFNLLPVWPLDGGRILRAWLAPRLGDGNAVRVLARIGVWVGLGLVAAAVALSVATRQLIWVPALSGVFLWRAARPDARAGQQAIIRTLTRRNLRLPQGVGPAAMLVARHTAAGTDVLRRLRQDRYHVVCVIDDHGSKLGQLTEDEFASGLVDLGIGASAGQLLAHACRSRRPPLSG